MNSIKKNNSGLTLIELLVTITIIGIVAIPFLNSFIQSMNANVDARRLQNANLVAQSAAEEFKAESLSVLLSKYADKLTTTSASDKLDVHKFSGIHVEGADGEDFYIDLELDPNLVYDAEGNCINGGNLPLFSNLYGGDTLIIFKKYVESDSMVERASHKKIVDIDIVCKDTVLADDTSDYTYTVTMNICYEDAAGNRTAPVKQVVEKKYSADELHTVYLLAPVFDKYSQLSVDGEGNYLASDSVNIKYTYSGTEGREKEFVLYFAEQAYDNVSNPEKLSRLNPKNITISYEGEGFLIDTYDSSDELFKINTNVGKKTTESVTDTSLTYSESNIAKSLYLMTIDVHYRTEDGEVLTTFTSTKEE